MCECLCVWGVRKYECSCTWRPEEGVRFPGAGIAGGHESSDTDVRTWTLVFCKSSVNSCEPALQHHQSLLIHRGVWGRNVSFTFIAHSHPWEPTRHCIFLIDHSFLETWDICGYCWQHDALVILNKVLPHVCLACLPCYHLQVNLYSHLQRTFT